MAFHEYPYTNFHEMNLDWVIAQVKVLTEAWAQVQTDWTNQQEAFDTLKSWIENYFANLNVQTEINNKIDELVLNGTMSELIAPYVASGLPAEVASQIGDVVATQIGAVVAAQLPGVVSAQLPAIAAQAAADEVGSWLSTHIDPDTGYVIDDSLTVQGAAADAKAVGDEVTAIKSALTLTNGTAVTNLIPLIANKEATSVATSPTSNYYRTLRNGADPYTLDTMKTYCIAITVGATGKYKIQSGSAASAGSMVDTIYDGVLNSGVNFIENYTPTGAYEYLRCDVNEEWDATLYIKFSNPLTNDVRDLMNKSMEVLSVSVADFNTTYGKTIGNLPVQRIVNITPSHDAVDFPMGISGYYTIMTLGEASSPSQIAIELNGKMYRRKKSTTGWKNWLDEAIDYSNVTLSGGNPSYTDFNDFPIGSIIALSSLELDNSPIGYNNTGHDTMDVGTITANVMTFATYPHNPLLITQICSDYRQSISGYPNVSFRTAQLISGNYVWSKWSTFSQDGVIHATNKIVDINHLDYTFDDFNDAPINTVYQVDFNVGSSVANNPAPGKSGSLMTWGFSNSTRHALSQFYLTHESDDACMYFRYGFYTSGTTYEWTPWQKVVTQVVS